MKLDITKANKENPAVKKSKAIYEYISLKTEKDELVLISTTK